MTPTDVAGSLQISDPRLRGSEHLFQSLGEAECRAAIEQSGWSVLDSNAVQCLYSPGRSVVVRRAIWAERNGVPRRFSVVREIRSGTLSAGVDHAPTEVVSEPILQDGPDRRTWVFPFDPYLPDLADALSIDGARRLGESVVGFRCSVRSEVVRYRPGKRAVLRYHVRPRGRSTGAATVLYLKIVRPRTAGRIMAGAEWLSDLDPRFVLPDSRPAPGVIVYQAIEGTNLRDALIDRTNPLTRTGVHDEVWDAAARIAGRSADGLDAAPSPERRLRRAVTVLTAIVPTVEHRLERLSSRILDALDGCDRPTTAIHGDLYEGQVMLDHAGRLTGLLDFDDVAAGDPAMDAANVLAHLSTLGESHPHASDRLERHRRAARDRLRSRMDVSEAALDAREAIAVLQLAAGPFRVLDENWLSRTVHRIDLAEQLSR